jgi:hypothetical protein
MCLIARVTGNYRLIRPITGFSTDESRIFTIPAGADSSRCGPALQREVCSDTGNRARVRSPRASFLLLPVVLFGVSLENDALRVPGTEDGEPRV